MFEGIGDDGDGEMFFLYFEDGEADAVQADGAFFDDERAKLCGEVKPEFPATPFFFSIQADGRGIDMALDDMAVEATVHDQASFQVDEVAGLPVAEIGLFEGFVNGGDLVKTILHGLDGQADAIMRDALVRFQLGGKGGSDSEYFISSLIIN